MGYGWLFLVNYFIYYNKILINFNFKIKGPIIRPNIIYNEDENKYGPTKIYGKNLTNTNGLH
jgi:hypothetical protein